MSTESLIPKEEVTPLVQKLSRAGIEMILNHSDFEATYRSGTNMPAKYAIAVGLIEDGRYENPLFLLKNLIPQKQPIDDQKQPIDPKEAKRLKEDLAFLLLQKGIISPKTKEADDATEHLERELEADQNMKDLALSSVPVEVLGQILTLEKFSHVSREDKLEELRSWTTHAMLRWYLGTLSGEMPRRDLTTIEIMDRIPKEIFSNPYILRYNLIENYFEKRFMKHITDTGIEKGLKTVEEVVAATDAQERKSFAERVYERLYDIATFPLKGDFKEKILVKRQDRTFPSFEQRTFTYDFVHHNTRLLTAGTGLGKTGGAYLTMENSDATKVLVLAPANGRETWRVEENVVFQKPGNIFVVNGSSDLERASIVDKKYIVIGQELLGRAENHPILAKRLQTLVSKAKIDGGVIDEIDNLSNPSSYATKTALSLISKIRENYQDRTGSDNAPIIGLTATPIRTGLPDLNVPMAMLYPKDYAATPGGETATRKTFSDTYLNNPHLTYIALSGERRMFRWESATGVQELEYDPNNSIRIKISAFEQLLYEFIGSEVDTDALNKIRLLEDTLLNPLLVKAEVRSLANGKIPQIDLDEALETIKKAAAAWKELRGVDNPESGDDYLSSDKLVELGFGDVVLGSFFSDRLENGVDTLAAKSTESSDDPELETLSKFWSSRPISSKYQHLEKLLEESLAWNVAEDGTLSRNKVMIISPTKRQGRTGDVLQREIEGENLYTEDELDTVNDSKLVSLVEEWTGEKVLLLDGSVSIGRRRDSVINLWVNNPNDPVLLANLKAVYQSRDFTISNVEDKYGRKIKGVTKIFLHWPWYWQQYKQMVGRSQRQGQLVPVDTVILEAEGLIDQGKGEVVRYTNLLQRIALSGGTLIREDQEFFDSKRVGRNKIRFQSLEQRFLRDVFNMVRGAGEDEVNRFMTTTVSGHEKNNYQRFAERFFDEGKDEYRTSGYNAELVASLIRRLNLTDGSILSIGGGTLLLQRKLGIGIDNVDMNPYVMEAGWQMASEFGGRMITARASRLDKEEFPDGSYDTIDSSFTLHWSKLGDNVEESERVSILSRINRLLKINGKFFLTFPEGAFDDERFEKFMGSLESSFGSKTDRQYCGKSYGVSRVGSVKRLGWCIVGEKIGDVNLENLQLSDLEFYNERREWLSLEGKKQKEHVVKSSDYPTPDLQLKFDRYEIVGTDNTATTISLSEDATSAAPEDTTENIMEGGQPVVIYDANLSFLKGVTRDQYESYRKDLVRKVVKNTGLNWEGAEELSKSIYQEMVNQGLQPTSRMRAYQLILREIEKRQRSSEEGR